MNKSIIDEDVNMILNSDFDFNSFRGKTILISGANGYVPSYFIHTFMALNGNCDSAINVIALCRNENRAKKRFERYLGRSDFRLLIQDVCDPITVEGAIDYFIHAASPAGIWSRHDDPVNTFEANVLGLRNMLICAANKKCEGFLFLSSVDVYGTMSMRERLKEYQAGCLDPLNVRNVYSCAKRAAETMCKAYQVKYDLPIYIVRPFQIIGPGPELNDGRLHIDFISQIIDKQKIVLKSDGTAVRSFMYITDAILAMLTVMIEGKVGEAYNIANEACEATVKELADIMASESKYDVSVEYDMSTRNNIEVTSAISVVTGDATKLRELGWKPQMDLRDACHRMMKYYEVAD